MFIDELEMAEAEYAEDLEMRVQEYAELLEEMECGHDEEMI